MLTPQQKQDKAFTEAVAINIRLRLLLARQEFRNKKYNGNIPRNVKEQA